VLASHLGSDRGDAFCALWIYKLNMASGVSGALPRNPFSVWTIFGQPVRALGKRFCF
jgi:hypothetical protein